MNSIIYFKKLFLSLIIIPLPVFKKLCSHPLTKFTTWKLQWTAVKSNKNFTWIHLISIQPLLKLSFVITDWFKLIWRQFFWIKHSKCGDHVWLTAVHCNFHIMNFVRWWLGSFEMLVKDFSIPSQLQFWVNLLYKAPNCSFIDTVYYPECIIIINKCGGITQYSLTDHL